MSKKLVSILLFSMVFVGCDIDKPKYKAGDCVQDDPTDYCEKWEACHFDVYKILEVGIKHYRAAFTDTRMSAVGIIDDSFTIDVIDYKSHKVECPALLKDVK